MSDPSKQTTSTSDTPSQSRYPQGYWDAADEYLRDCYLLQHIDDYLEFLVTRVWRLNEPCRLVEFGCGTGKMGW